MQRRARVTGLLLMPFVLIGAVVGALRRRRTPSGGGGGSGPPPAGVREPRRPKPNPPVATVAREPDAGE